MNNPIYEIESLDYKKGNNFLLKIKKFEIHRGACYMFKGEMGAGKTLLLSTISRVNKGYNGKIKYDNKDLKSISSSNFNKEVSIVQQIEKRPFFTTSYKYIYNYVSKKNNKVKSEKFINSIVKTMNLKHLLDIKVRDLTPSQFRWVDLAAKIASNPKVLFIDEIEQHLSKDCINILNKILYKKCNYDGVTLVCSSQNAGLFSSLISVTISLKHGRISSLRSRSRKK